MSNVNSFIKPSDTANYSGLPSPQPTDMGREQCGAWADVNQPPFGVGVSVLEGLPAAVKVSLSGNGIRQVGAPNQFACQISIKQGTLQLTGHVSTAQNVNTDPAITSYTWYSRQQFVATVNASGLVTPVGRGSTTIECRYSRAVNAPFAGARGTTCLPRTCGLPYSATVPFWTDC
jgi:Bacterial Ig-like domain (group 2)